MNDLSGAGKSGHSVCGSVPAPLVSVLAAVLLLGIAYSLFILVVVHNALLLAAIMLLSALVVSFVLWNLLSYKKNLAILCFVDRLPASDLLSASDGQLVKITGLASCGDFALESSYEKVQRCVYTSTLLYENRSFWCKILSAKNHHSVPMATSSDERYYCWKLTYLERFSADFYIVDAKSGLRALVKAGYDSRIVPLVTENLIVNTTNKSRMVSSTLKRWLEERSLPLEARLLRLEEGFIMEGASLTVVGMLNKMNGSIMIVPPPNAISTGCLPQKLLLPVDFDGLVLRFSPTRT